MRKILKQQNPTQKIIHYLRVLRNWKEINNKISFFKNLIAD